MTRKGNKVYIETLYRYAPTKKYTMTYKKFKDWRLEILKLGGK